MASDFEREQDAKAAEIGISIERSKIDVPKLNYKGLQRKDKEKNQLLNQKIKLTLFDSSGEVREGCEFQIERKKLTARHLQEMISRCPLPGKLECVQNMTTQELVMPEEMQIKCEPDPYQFRVILREIRVAQDIMEDAHFAGYMRLVMTAVPRQTDKGDVEVKEEDLRAYLRCGIVEEHPEVMKAKEMVERVKVDIEQLEKSMKRIPKLKPTDEEGNPLPAELADAERQRLYDASMKEKDLLERKMENFNANMELQTKLVNRIPFELELASVNSTENTTTWYITFDAPDIDEEGNEIGFNAEASIVSKNDWDGIRLCTGFQEVKKKLKAEKTQEIQEEEHTPRPEYTQEGDEQDIVEIIDHPPWAGRGLPPDGTKEWLPDYTPYAVNMKGARIMRVQHGIGLHKQLNHDDVDFYGSYFELYHGQWVQGKRHGMGQSYSERGVYSGEWDSGRIRGHGHFEFPHGAAFRGIFGVRSYHQGQQPEGDVYDLPPLPSNPYQHGLPNGSQGTFSFPDGSIYQGQLVDGRICGRGRYENAMGEVSEGNFKNGKLDGDGFLADMIGSKWDGFWKDGQLHHEGTYTSRYKDRYVGPWKRFERCGRGFERYKNGNQSVGYYLLNDRVGHGVMHHGHVRERWDKKLQKYTLSRRKSFEGFWLGGRAAKRGCDTSYPFKQRYYTINTKIPEKRQFLRRVYDIDFERSQRTKELTEKYRKLDLYVRREVTRKKLKIFRWQAQSAKEALLEDSFEPKDQNDVVQSISRRQAFVDKTVGKKHLSQEEAERAIKQLPLSVSADQISAVAENQGDLVYKPPIVTLVQSEFEAAEEQRRFVNYDSILDMAKRKMRKDDPELALTDQQ